MKCEAVSLHGVDETIPWEGGSLLQRVPEGVRRQLNPKAQRQMRRPGTSELRFVPGGEDAVEVTLSSVPVHSESGEDPNDNHGPNGDGGSEREGNGATGVPEVTIDTFWGPLQADRTLTVGPEPTTFSFTPPELTDELDPEMRTRFAFDPEVCRLRFHPHSDGVVLHDVNGDRRPPADDEVPATRYLAYGTSITDGIAASAPHLTYPLQTARRLGWDAVNLGSQGSAYCEPAVADYIADREDWAVATFGLSVNMLAEFSVESFADRVSYLLRTVGATGRPTIALTIFPFHPGVFDDPDATVSSKLSAFREAVHEIAAEAPPNVRSLAGPELLSPAGLSDDLLHPGDHGMIEIGERLAAELDGLP